MADLHATGDAETAITHSCLCTGRTRALPLGHVGDSSMLQTGEGAFLRCHVRHLTLPYLTLRHLFCLAPGGFFRHK